MRSEIFVSLPREEVPRLPARSGGGVLDPGGQGQVHTEPGCQHTTMARGRMAPPRHHTGVGFLSRTCPSTARICTRGIREASCPHAGPSLQAEVPRASSEPRRRASLWPQARCLSDAFPTAKAFSRVSRVPPESVQRKECRHPPGPGLAETWSNEGSHSVTSLLRPTPSGRRPPEEKGQVVNNARNVHPSHLPEKVPAGWIFLADDTFRH